MNWTKKQEEAINEKGEILVAAAAGSGKTAVLVERNIRKIIDEGIDINKILAITFTTAAASEMKERILNSLYAELEKNETDEIKRQIRLLPKANISTIHSFCFNIIKENFFNLNLASDISVGQSEELELILQEALDIVLEEEYESEEKEFHELLSMYSSYRDDNKLREEIIRIHKFLSSIPFYKDWIDLALERISEDVEDYSKSFYGSIIFKEIKEIVNSNIKILKKEEKNLKIDSDLTVFKNTISADIQMIEEILKYDSWDELYNYVKDIKFSKWPSIRNFESRIKDEAKSKRDLVKEEIENIKKIYIREKTESIIEDNKATMSNTKKIYSLAIALEDKYNEIKRKKNLLDFNDLEKLSLELLVKKEGNEYKRTEIAENIARQYKEIQVDEYQDINLMQELIIWAISNNNVFRVGDLKQSIYKFRNANPDIFIEKYNKFSESSEEINNEEKIGSKILLYQNFRSRKNILDFSNDLFSKIMSESLGEINYDENEYLNYSANYNDKEISTDIVLINKEDISKENSDTDEEDDENEDLDDFNEELRETLEDLETIQLEAYYIAEKIKDIIESEFLIKEGGIERPVEYRDIVILLRSAKNKADIIEKILYEKGIPVYADFSENFLNSIEISIIMSLLNIINNPLSDIDFVAIMRSYFGGFSFNEIANIRTYNRKSKMYYTFLEYIEKTNNEKAIKFIKFLENLKEREKHLGITNLINYILIDTGYMNYISLENNADIKKANLKLFITKAQEYEKTGGTDLNRFIQYLTDLKSTDSDIASANIIGEKENVARIMTIHSSKGLEFPVVFLSNANKRANMKDLNENILMNYKYGTSIDYFDYKKKIKYPLLIKEAMKIKLKEEIISEEMRVLYVALTRAKEKLIITSSMKNAEKYYKDIMNLAEIYTDTSKDKIANFVSPQILKKKLSFLDWIMLSYYSGLSSAKFSLINAKNLDFHEVEEVKGIMDIKVDTLDDDIIHNVDIILENLNYIYPFEDDFYPKIAASRLHMSEEKIIEENIKNLITKKPKYMRTKKLTAADKGSLNHFFLEKLDLTKKHNEKDLEIKIIELIEDELITEEESTLIDLNNIINFINTDEYQIILKSKIVKEKQFIAKFNLKEIEDLVLNNIDGVREEKDFKNESVLIQGIIDLYYITEDDRLKILDYKTDNLNPEEIKERYKTQMLTYKMALEKALKRKVDEVLIYSTANNKYIEIIN